MSRKRQSTSCIAILILITWVIPWMIITGISMFRKAGAAT